MRNFVKNNIVIVPLVIVIFFLSFFKLPQQNNQNFINSDATWHTLLTVKAMQETPASVHRFLPIVSLGGEDNKNIPWGATVSDQYGNYYYTSFMPLSFIIPYVYFQTFQLELSESNLYWLSTFFSIVCFVCLYYFFLLVFGNYLPRWFIATLLFLLYFFLPEMLHSNSMIFWGQSVYQLAFIWQLIFFIKLYRENNIFNAMIFSVIGLISCLSEWTGYIANIGFVIALLINTHGFRTKDKGFYISRANLIAAIGVITASISALVVFVLHYLQVTSLPKLFLALTARLSARSTIRFGELLKGYWASFHWSLIIASILIIGVLIILFKAKRLPWGHISLLFFVTLFPLLENILLMEHATSYTYDRMKFIFPLCLSFFACTAYFNILIKKNRGKWAAAILIPLMVIGAHNWNTYNELRPFGNTTYKWNEGALSGNIDFSNYIYSNYVRGNLILGSIYNVRGYDNLLFDQSIYELADGKTLYSIAKVRGKGYAVLLRPEVQLWNKNIHKCAEIINLASNEVGIIIRNENDVITEYKNSVFAANVSDDQWKFGVDVSHNKVLIEYNPVIDRILSGTSSLKANGFQAKIVAIERSDNWISVVCEQDADLTSFYFPNIITVEHNAR